MSETAALPLALGDSDRKALALRIPRRPLKIVTAGALAFAGAYGILSEQQYVTSSNAVVSAYILDVRTPIDGTVTGVPHAPGTSIESGDVLAHIENPLVDHQHLDNLRTLRDVAESTAEADSAEAAALAGLQRDLITRASAHSEAVTARLSLSVAEATSTLAAREAAMTEARIEFERGRQLHQAGILPSAEFDKLVSADAIAKRQTEAQRSILASLQAQTEAARGGLLAEPGTNNDVAYSRQRADEVAIKLAETHRSLAASTAQARLALASVTAEQMRSNVLRATDLRSPIGGMLWQIDAMNGERVATGDPVLAMVDCTRQFLLVEVPQERLPDIAIGGEARFKLTGETEQRTGKVLSVSGDPQRDSNRKFAAFPVQDTSLQLATVRVQLDARTCTVGRTARVLLPTNPTNVAARAFRRYF